MSIQKYTDNLKKKIQEATINACIQCKQWKYKLINTGFDFRMWPTATLTGFLTYAYLRIPQ